MKQAMITDNTFIQHFVDLYPLSSTTEIHFPCFHRYHQFDNVCSVASTTIWSSHLSFSPSVTIKETLGNISPPCILFLLLLKKFDNAFGAVFRFFFTTCFVKTSFFKLLYNFIYIFIFRRFWCFLLVIFLL